MSDTDLGLPDLAIIPGTTHYDVGESPLFAAVVLDFLADPPPVQP